LLFRDGRIVPVEAIERRRYRDKVYNFHVERFECYAVGRNSILVHNNSQQFPESELLRRGHRIFDSRGERPGKFGQAEGRFLLKSDSEVLAGTAGSAIR
jgi:hypothetical protein